MNATITAELTGLSQALQNLQQFERRVARKVLQKAVRAGAAPFVASVRKLAPRSNGALRRSLTQKIKTYPQTGTVVAIIGQNKKSAGRPKKIKGGSGGISGRGDLVPIHLVDQPVRAHSMFALSRSKLAKVKRARDATKLRQLDGKNWTATARLPGGWRTLQLKRQHPGHAGRRFIERAAREAGGSSTAAFTTKLEAEVMAEAAAIGGTSGGD